MLCGSPLLFPVITILCTLFTFSSIASVPGDSGSEVNPPTARSDKQEVGSDTKPEDVTADGSDGAGIVAETNDQVRNIIYVQCNI